MSRKLKKIEANKIHYDSWKELSEGYVHPKWKDVIGFQFEDGKYFTSYPAGQISIYFSRDFITS